MTRTISIHGARGGQGASTVAAVLALFSADHQPTELLAHDPTDMAALLGIAGAGAEQGAIFAAPDVDLGWCPTSTPSLVIHDAGSRLEAPESPETDERYVVVRGPCYLALRRLVAAHGSDYDGVILINEPARSLRARCR